jgi:hypothetical protein
VRWQSCAIYLDLRKFSISRIQKLTENTGAYEVGLSVLGFSWVLEISMINYQFMLSKLFCRNEREDKKRFTN